jgi:hypothetical protein
MDEVGFWAERIRPNLTKNCQAMSLRFHFERIENVVADGTPDVNYCIDGVEGGIELKFSDTSPGDTAQVLGIQHGMRRSQIIYASRRVWSGGLCWCLIGNRAATWLVDLRGMSPADMASLSVASSARLRQVAAWHCGQRMGGTLPLALIERLPGPATSPLPLALGSVGQK